MKTAKILNRITVMAVGAALSTAALTGCGAGNNNSSNPAIPGVTGPTVAIVGDTFSINVVLTEVTLDGGIEIAIPHMPNSYVQAGPDLQSAGFLIGITLSLADLNSVTGNNLLNIPATELPGGRPLPGLAAGQLPGIAVTVPKWDNLVFYLGSDIFGVFVPVQIPVSGLELSYRFFDTAGAQLGNISVIGEDSTGKNSGFLLMIDIAGTVADAINGAL